VDLDLVGRPSSSSSSDSSEEEESCSGRRSRAEWMYFLAVEWSYFFSAAEWDKEGGELESRDAQGGGRKENQKLTHLHHSIRVPSPAHTEPLDRGELDWRRRGCW